MAICCRTCDQVIDSCVIFIPDEKPMKPIRPVSTPRFCLSSASLGIVVDDLPPTPPPEFLTPTAPSTRTRSPSRICYVT
ncbi:hypothetical protein CCACVL1_30131 [Corchorus capsularis]|uniref:Uncharacterized protein n=1 Tax=Corchorus capsularis TaxID=210143 RepID=A0A1R3FYT9_COCAP|nr:hypothetical protein CCACVL1_30131 [Corchorus capsularis]